MKQLPIFKGWTVDVRLKQFRLVTAGKEGPEIDFLPFDSEEGDELLAEYIEQLDDPLALMEIAVSVF